MYVDVVVVGVAKEILLLDNEYFVCYILLFFKRQLGFFMLFINSAKSIYENATAADAVSVRCVFRHVYF